MQSYLCINFQDVQIFHSTQQTSNQPLLYDFSNEVRGFLLRSLPTSLVHLGLL